MELSSEEKLSRPIHHKATGHSAEIELKTFQDVIQFVEREISHLDANRQIAGAGAEGLRIHGLLKEPYVNIKTKLDELSANTEEKSALVALEKCARAEVKRVVDGSSWTRNSEISTVYERINHQYGKLGFTAAFLGTVIDPTSDSVLNSSSNPQYRTELAAGRAIAFLTGFAQQNIDQLERRAVRDAIKAAREAERATQQLRDELREDAQKWEQERQAAARATDEQASRIVAEHKSHLEALYVDHAERMGRVESDFKERLIMEAPAEYWEKRAKQARWNARWAFGGFVALVAGFMLLVSSVAPNHLGHVVSALQSAIVPENSGSQNFSGIALVFSFALISTPAIMALWTLMLVSRIFRENLHLANDAKHRNMLITTYLALAEDKNNPISKDDREFALNAIFSVPSEASADDAVTSLVFPRAS